MYEIDTNVETRFENLVASYLMDEIDDVALVAEIRTWVDITDPNPVAHCYDTPAFGTLGEASRTIVSRALDALIDDIIAIHGDPFYDYHDDPNHPEH